MSTDLALQKLIHDQLIADAGVSALVGSRIYDAVPQSAQVPYISFGPDVLVNVDAECIAANEHSFQIDIWSEDPSGYAECKRIGSAVRLALNDYDAEPEAGGTNGLHVSAVRYITDPDGITRHGIVTVLATMEEI
ncbi:MAG: DUF3168 domain-containing protein [bacterium]|nr:DUF3168 domain-containing protein [bacterium]